MSLLLNIVDLLYIHRCVGNKSERDLPQGIFTTNPEVGHHVKQQPLPSPPCPDVF